MREVWKDIPNFEGCYQISNMGYIRSLDRFIEYSTGGVRLVGGVLLKPQKNTGGYYQNNLYKNMKHIRVTIHRLVAELFVDGRESDLEVNHIDGDKSNNKYTNLEWCTKSHNQQHKYDNNLIEKMWGSGNPAAKLIEADVLEIDRLLQEGLLQKDIANRFNVSVNTISNIKLRKCWKKVLT